MPSCRRAPDLSGIRTLQGPTGGHHLGSSQSGEKDCELTRRFCYGERNWIVGRMPFRASRSLAPVPLERLSSMPAPIFSLSFVRVAFMCKHPEDKSSYADTQSEG